MFMLLALPGTRRPTWHRGRPQKPRPERYRHPSAVRLSITPFHAAVLDEGVTFHWAIVDIGGAAGEKAENDNSGERKEEINKTPHGHGRNFRKRLVVISLDKVRTAVWKII